VVRKWGGVHLSGRKRESITCRDRDAFLKRKTGETGSLGTGKMFAKDEQTRKPTKKGGSQAVKITGGECTP